jgi:regulator of RNase E activity RraA
MNLVLVTRGASMPDIWVTYHLHLDLLGSAVLADALDRLGHRTSALPSNVRPLKPEWKIFGRAATLRAAPVSAIPEHPYAVELACIDALRTGDVLVAATEGNRDCSLWGELLSTSARAHGAVAAVIAGMTRDASRIVAMNFPVFAEGYHPLDCKGRLEGVSHGQPIQLGPCLVRPGDWVVGDVDGVVIVPEELAEQAFAQALEKVTAEDRVRAELAKGRSVREVFNEYGVL